MRLLYFKKFFIYSPTQENKIYRPPKLTFIKWKYFESHLKDCCCSVTKSCLTLCDPANHSTPGFLPGVCSNSCPLSWWCHPTISFSATPFSSRPQSFPSSESFPKSWLFASGGQRTGASSASASVLSMNIQGWFPLGSLLEIHPIINASKYLLKGRGLSLWFHIWWNWDSVN